VRTAQSWRFTLAAETGTKHRTLVVDNANRLTNTITPLNRQIQQVWNSRELLQSITQPSTRATTLSYDSKTRLTNRTDNVGTTLYQYDPNNNLTNVAESGKTNSWAFDAYDRTTSYTDANGNQIQYRWDANGNLTNLIYPGNRTVTYAYDSLNRLTNVTDWSSRQTTITYDIANRPTTITRPNGSLRVINYDAAGQPTNIVERLSNNAPVAFYTLSWNNAGRVQWEFGAPLPHTNALPTRTMTFDDDNRLATFNRQNITNDLDGNMTWGPLANNTLVAYSYDARNGLLNADGASYDYDALGNRTSVTNGTNVVRFVVNPNARLSQVLMRVKGGTTNYYIYGLGLLYEITETASSTNTLTYHYDLRGSTIAITDSSGAVKERFEYSAYGSLTYRSDSTDTPFLFNGRYGVQTDTNGLLYMRARYYNPYICRFINPDPTGFAGGLNWYCYADGNPINLIDPFGLGPVEGWGGATATWVNRNVVGPLNSVSTTSTTLNFASYMAGSIIGGLGDMLRLGQGTAYAAYNAEDGYDIAIGITQDVGRAAGVSLSAAGPLGGALGGSASRLIGVTESEASALARQIHGSLVFRSDSTDTPFLFNGRYGVQTDTNGLLYMRARYYNPYICRFINPDPSGFAGGLNWYCYADGNPVSLIDPFGLGPIEGWGGATATSVNRNVVGPLNSISTTSTTVNFASYLAASIIGGFPLCPVCRSPVHVATKPEEARALRIPAGMRCSKNPRHFQVEFNLRG
jgi:RHS repeat-associated protein